VQPPIDNRPLCRRGILEVPGEDVAALDEDLAVFGDLDVDPAPSLPPSAQRVTSRTLLFFALDDGQEVRKGDPTDR